VALSQPPGEADVLGGAFARSVAGRRAGEQLQAVDALGRDLVAHGPRRAR
jgi:hypothetical protein